MNIFQLRLQTLCRAIDKEDTGIRIQIVEPAEVTESTETYRVIKEFGGERKVVSFGNTYDEARTFVNAMPSTMRRVETPAANGESFECPQFTIEEE